MKFIFVLIPLYYNAFLKQLLKTLIVFEQPREYLLIDFNRFCYSSKTSDPLKV